MNVVQIRGRQRERHSHSDNTYQVRTQIYTSFKETRAVVQLQTFSVISVGCLDNGAPPFEAISLFL